MQLQKENNIGQLIKQKRVTIPLTLSKLSNDSGVSTSHLGRIERVERFPSARVLRRIAKPLGFEENELFMLAGFLSDHSDDKNTPSDKMSILKLDPFVASTLAREPVEIQRAIIGILSLIKSVAKESK